MLKKKRFQACFLLLAVFLVGACGEDDVAPADPSSSTIIPDAVFFNLTAGDEVVLFSGRATDNRWVDTVSISFDGGGTWKDADIDPTPSVRNVSWSYYATDSDIPSPSTVLIRVVDQDANETTSSPVNVRKSTGATTGSLLAFFSAAGAGEVLALSSGSGYAFGSAGTALNVPVNVDLTVLGAGRGDDETSGGIVPPGNPIATILQTSAVTPAIFQVSANLTLRNIRLVGAENGIHVEGADAAVMIQDCLFDRQNAWAVRAVGGGDAISIRFLSNVVDASSSNDASGGGLYLDDVEYEVSGSSFYLKNDDAEGAAVQVVGGSGTVDDSIFQENYLAIWASGGSPVITDCNILGGSYGINLTGESDSIEILRNTIDGHFYWGLLIGGSMTPLVRENIISNNGRSGIYIDFTGPSSNVMDIDLGKDIDPGLNDLFDNFYPEIPEFPDTVEVFVSSRTGVPDIPIPADGNYWGTSVPTAVRGRIYDGYQTSDNRARLNYNVNLVKTFPQN